MRLIPQSLLEATRLAGPPSYPAPLLTSHADKLATRQAAYIAYIAYVATTATRREENRYTRLQYPL
jgi:hypothetical protein